MFFRFVVYKPWFMIALTILFAIPFFLAIPHIQQEQDSDYVSVQNHPEFIYSEHFSEIFDNTEFFLIAFEAPEIFESKVLNTLDALTKQLEDLELVYDTLSLSNVNDIVGKDEDFIVGPLMEGIPKTPQEFSVMKKRALANPLYDKILITPNSQTTTIIINPDQYSPDEDYRVKLLENVDKILNSFKDQGYRFHLAGGTILSVELQRALMSDMSKFIPFSYLVIVLVLTFMFRSLRLAVMAFISISFALICTFGVFAFTGSTMNNFTSIVPSLIMALGLANGIHVFSHFQQNQVIYEDKREALLKALQETYRPSLFTTLTTSIGFLSLMLSGVTPISQFGVTAGISVWWAFIYTFTFLPAAIAFFPPTLSHSRWNIQTWIHLMIEKLIIFNQKYYRWIIIFFIGIVIFSLFNIAQIRVETNLTKWFKPHTNVQKAIQFLESRMAGVENIEISIWGNEEGLFKNPVNLHYLDQVQQFLNGLPEIDKTISFVDFLKDMHQSFHNEEAAYYRIPETRNMVAQYLFLYNDDDIDDYINHDINHARLTARSSKHSSAELKELLNKIRDYLATHPPPSGLEARPTGGVVNTTIVIDELVGSQIKSLTTTIAVILVCMFVVYWSIPLGLLSLIPNLFPIILNFGIMGLFDIALNSGTALISASVFGIVVDDTIHLLYHYNKQRKQGLPKAEAIASAMRVKGAAVTTTSIVLFFGFGIMILGSFIPLNEFGFLTSLIMITALVGDLIFLPALLQPWSKKN